MLDIPHIPSIIDSTKIFYAQGATTWQTWQKPRGAKFIQIFCVGSGGGGATGASANGSRTGGGGGAGAGVSRAIVPAFLIPDTLYIQVAVGGVMPLTTGTGATGGVAGAISYVSFQPSTAVANLLLASSNTAAAGGTATNNNSAGATVFVNSNAGFSYLSTFSATAGPAGNLSTSSYVDPSPGQTALSSFLFTGGAGGGSATPGTATAGGNISPAPVILLSVVSGSTGNPTGAASAANNGYTIMAPFCSTGGGGGGGTGASGFVVGKGGDAGFGSGGGGTGAGQNQQFRKGGNGGNGIVIITTIF